MNNNLNFKKYIIYFNKCIRCCCIRYKKNKINIEDTKNNISKITDNKSVKEIKLENKNIEDNNKINENIEDDNKINENIEVNIEDNNKINDIKNTNIKKVEIYYSDDTFITKKDGDWIILN